VGDAGAVVIGGYVNAVGVIRALAARNVATAVITTKPYDIAHHSRWVRGHAAAYDLEEAPERLADLLEARADQWRGWALIPTNDGALAALSRFHDRLSSTYRVFAPPAEVARYFLDKARMLEAAHAIGLESPRCYGPAVSATAAGAVRFPVVVKPDEGYRFFSRFGCKLFAADDPEQLASCIAKLGDAGLRGQIYDLIPGPDSQIYAYCTYVDERGTPSAGLTIRKLRQSPPRFGVARAAEVAPHDDTMREATIELARRIGHRGIAVAEFKRDPRDGRFRFMEINGRSVIYNGLLRRAGLDLEALMWAEHMDRMDGAGERTDPEQWPGVWIHLHADVLYSLLYRRHEQLSFSEIVAPYRREKIYAVWSPSDPRPFARSAVARPLARHSDTTARNFPPAPRSTVARRRVSMRASAPSTARSSPASCVEILPNAASSTVTIDSVKRNGSCCTS
jgi:predicted ATP-grasp superfamily ATP-dependent carboligase